MNTQTTIRNVARNSFACFHDMSDVINSHQVRCFALIIQLVENAIQRCELAEHLSDPELAHRVGLRARALYGKIALFWRLNVPIKDRPELDRQSLRLKKAILELEDAKPYTALPSLKHANVAGAKAKILSFPSQQPDRAGNMKSASFGGARTAHGDLQPACTSDF